MHAHARTLLSSSLLYTSCVSVPTKLMTSLKNADPFLTLETSVSASLAPRESETSTFLTEGRPSQLSTDTSNCTGISRFWPVAMASPLPIFFSILPVPPILLEKLLPTRELHSHRSAGGAVLLAFLPAATSSAALARPWLRATHAAPCTPWG